MRPTRRTQPHRRTGRQPGAGLQAMLAGRGALGNPMDVRRQAQRMAKGRRGRRVPAVLRMMRRQVGRPGR